MTDKSIERLFKVSMARMRRHLPTYSYEQYRWLFLEAFQQGIKEAQKIYKENP